MKERESLATRLGFIMLSVGCAVGLGNVWRFPFVTGKYGGGMFVLLYLIFLMLFGFPVLVMELSLGRAGQANLVGSIRNLSGNKKCWSVPAWIIFSGSLLLMIYYTTVTGWLLAYAGDYLDGTLVAVQNAGEIETQFNSLIGSPWRSGGYMAAGVVLSTAVCAVGLRSGVEKVVKIMMLLLFLLVFILAGYALTQPGAAEGMKFYLLPDWGRFSKDIGGTVFAALGQAFFTLSIGVGSMAIFGSYISKERSLAGESCIIILLDTVIALFAGVIIFPICFSSNVDVNSGPALIFLSLPNIFRNISGGRILGALFFIFLSCAALTTVIAVFENLIALLIDEFKFKRIWASLTVGAGVGILSIPCVLGFNIWKKVSILGNGTTILDFEDFLVSQNLLPIGAFLLVLFWRTRWQAFIAEANTGKGLRFPEKSLWYCKYVLPVLLLVVFVWGYKELFWKN